MTSPIEQIKETLTIEELVAAHFTVTGRGRTRSTKEHDSLILWPATNTWRWFSRDVGGDIFDWYQYIHSADFDTTLRALAQRAGVELRPLTPEEQQQRTHQQQHHQVLHIAAAHHHSLLTDHPDAAPARAYLTERGWSHDTIIREQLGYTLPNNSPLPVPTGRDGEGSSPDDNNTLSAELTTHLHTRLRNADLLDHPTARAVLSIPEDMIVYVHQHGGHVHYLSGRSVQGKRHYNLPERIGPDASGNYHTIAPKQPYHNHPPTAAHGDDSQHTILVEGQADAIALGQYGIPATALCGLDVTDGSLPASGEGWGGVTHVALDNDKPGQAKAVDLALAIGPTCGIVTWPATLRHVEEGKNHITVKDAGDLVRSAITREEIIELITKAPTALEELARGVRRHGGDLRIEAQRKVLDAFLALDDLVAADFKPRLADSLAVGLAQLNRMIKARQKEQETEAAAETKASPAREQYSAGGFIGGHLVEQFVDWDDTGMPFAYYYVRYPDGTIDRCPSVTIGGVNYMPINPMDDENITKQTVLFPSTLTDYGSETRLLADIRAYLHKWFDMEPFWERIVSYYILFTWFYDAGFETIPYLRALGDYGTGKTRFIESAGLLCYRPMLISGGDSEPVIFRMIDTYRGTMIVDEADFGDSTANALISKIINMGNRIKGNIKRLDGDNDYKIKVFMVFCPKVFAARYEFGDDALGSRCITKFMTKSDPRRDVPRDTDPSFHKDAQLIRNKLVHYRLRTWQPVTIDHTLTDYTIMARLSQITIALRTIIKDPEALAELDTYIHLYNASLIGERRMTDQAVIVHALARIHYGHDQADSMIKVEPDFTLKHIAEVAQELMSELDPERKLTSKSVSPIIRNQLGITARGRDNRRGGGATVVVTEQDLQQLMARYGVNLDQEED